MRAFSTNTEIMSSNWFADHLYRSDFWSFATDLPVLPQNNTLGENPFQHCKKWDSLAALSLHVRSVILFQGFYQPLPLPHLNSSLMLNINTTCTGATWQFQACQDEKEISAKPCERTGLKNFQNFQILLPFKLTWRRKCIVLSSCVKRAFQSYLKSVSRSPVVLAFLLFDVLLS